MSRLTLPGRGRVGKALWSGRALKRGTDVTAALSFLILFSPLLLSVIALLLLCQGRPLFIMHRRVGRGAKAFPCLKFRTMHTDAGAILEDHLRASPEAEAEWKATRKLKNDPRVTAIGKYLRKSSVDELPQFINVLKGEMSLVGPRPIVADEMSYYGPKIGHYLHVRPGLTGAWQVSGRSDTSYESRVKLDVDYVTNWTWIRDLKIMVKTVPAVLKSQGSY